MAPKRQSAVPPPSSTSTTSSSFTAPSSSTPHSSKSATSPPARTSTSASSDNASLQAVLQQAWDAYLKSTPQRIKLLDVFMGFLVFVGVVQFVYVVLAGNYVSRGFSFGVKHWEQSGLGFRLFGKRVRCSRSESWITLSSISPPLPWGYSDEFLSIFWALFVSFSRTVLLCTFSLLFPTPLPLLLFLCYDSY